jgi:DNA-binding NarL/FixJ family response regulator
LRERAAVTVAVGRLDPLVLCGVATLLTEEPSVRLLATGLDAPQLERVVRSERPNVVVVDDRVENSLLVRLQARATAVLVLAQTEHRVLSWTTLAATGVTLVSGSVSAEEFTSAVRLAARAPRTPRVGSRPLAPPDLASRLKLLSPREREVLMLIAKGRATREIAAELHIAVETVRSHTASIRRKFGVKSLLTLALGMAVTG